MARSHLHRREFPQALRYVESITQNGALFTHSTQHRMRHAETERPHSVFHNVIGLWGRSHPRSFSPMDFRKAQAAKERHGICADGENTSPYIMCNDCTATETEQANRTSENEQVNMAQRENIRHVLGLFQVFDSGTIRTAPRDGSAGASGRRRHGND